MPKAWGHFIYCFANDGGGVYAGQFGKDAPAGDYPAEAAAVVHYGHKVLLQQRVDNLVVARGDAERRAEITPHKV